MKDVLKVELHKENLGNTANVYFMSNSVDVNFYNEENYGTLVTIPRQSFEANKTKDLRDRLKEILTNLIQQL